ncbi:MAG: deoxyguanosinetriphosphate triphosphohydrolase [Ignavibacteriales bacterium]|nr:deoxyguanosinetriphosphate triphosphohydrolase [Ignavibacteriales bacterium]
MNWEKLLSRNRIGEPLNEDVQSLNGRSDFQRDFDRIVFCSAFRRLQDKTQVFPLPESDFVHTRLTHSLEVSCVGRSLGNFVGEKILQRRKKLRSLFTQFHFGEIVAAACLAHDIGNPPFGHSGEDAIAEYFKSGNGIQYKNILNKKQWTDISKFEGNAQGFRLVTKLQNQYNKGGLRLTYTVLGALTKYPKESFTTSAGEKLSNNIYSKFGFFQSEKNLFKEVAQAVQLEKKISSTNNLWWNRHPLAFLVEAADDICYRIMDLEDGFRLGLLSFAETENFLLPLIKSESINYSNRSSNDKIGYLRAKVIGSLVSEITEVFLEEEENILKGKFEEELISIIPSAKKLEIIKTISIEKIYRTQVVVEREAAGYEVLGGLLDIFIEAANDLSDGKISNRNRTILNLLPIEFRVPTSEVQVEDYDRLQMIIDFVSGMTDSFAVSLFRKLKGISLPGGRTVK